MILEYQKLAVTDRSAGTVFPGGDPQAARITPYAARVKMTTRMEDVAKEIGVSRVTLSRVLNESPNVAARTRRRVLDHVQRIGYRPHQAARALVRRRSDLVGIFCSHPENLLVQRILIALQSHLYERGLKTLFQTTRGAEHELEALGALARREVDGLVAFSHYSPPSRLADLVRDRRPIVLSGYGPRGVAVVRANGSGGMARIVRYLLGLGHRRIHYLGPPAPMYPEARDDRRAGWLLALREAGLEKSAMHSAALAIDAAGGFAGAQGLLLGATSRPSAIVCFNDEMAWGALRAAREIGLEVPGQISITGFDGLDLFRYGWPALTTCRLDPEHAGQLMAQTLFRLIEGDEGARQHHVYEGTFQAGESAGPATA